MLHCYLFIPRLVGFTDHGRKPSCQNQYCVNTLTELKIKQIVNNNNNNNNIKTRSAVSTVEKIPRLSSSGDTTFLQAPQKCRRSQTNRISALPAKGLLNLGNRLTPLRVEDFEN